MAKENCAGGWCALTPLLELTKSNDGPKTIAQHFNFNTGAYVYRLGQNPAAITDFRFGTSGRNTLIGPGITSLDASVNKAFRWKEGKQQMDLRGQIG